MEMFVHYVGTPGSSDFRETVTRRRSTSELQSLRTHSPAEWEFFERNQVFQSAFPDGWFNCWGVPEGARAPFQMTELGDLVLLVHSTGAHGLGIQQMGIVKAKAEREHWGASDILWPKWQGMRKFPFLLFFDTEHGELSMEAFFRDIGIRPRVSRITGPISARRPQEAR